MASMETIEPFPVKPIKVNIQTGSGNTVPREQVTIYYKVQQNPEEEYTSQKVLQVYPNQEIAFRFQREGFSDIATEPVRVPLGQATYTVYIPALEKWKSIEVAQREEASEALERLENSKRQAIEEYFASLFQFERIDESIPTVIQPAWRSDTVPPVFSNDEKEELNRLKSSRQTDPQLANRIDYLSIWAAMRNESLPKLLSDYASQHSEGEPLRKVQFALALLKNPSDLEIRTKGLGDLRWNAHRSFDRFGVDGLNRLRHLDEYRKQGGSINEYDLRLACCLAYIAWQDVIAKEYDRHMRNRQRTGLGREFQSSEYAISTVRESVRIVKDLFQYAKSFDTKATNYFQMLAQNGTGKPQALASTILSTGIISPSNADYSLSDTDRVIRDEVKRILNMN
jgi:hypothetical protein